MFSVGTILFIKRSRHSQLNAWALYWTIFWPTGIVFRVHGWTAAPCRKKLCYDWRIFLCTVRVSPEVAQWRTETRW